MLHRRRALCRPTFIATLVTGAVWAARRAFRIPLLGWWSPIVVDVFTRSAHCCAVPVRYPFTARGFDGIAWTRPGFMALNHVVLASAGERWHLAGAEPSRSS